MENKKLIGEYVWIYNEYNERLLCTPLVRQTEKAFCIIVDRGEFVVKEQNVWIPKSQAEITTNTDYKRFADQKANEYAVLYKIKLPNWILNKNNIK